MYTYNFLTSQPLTPKQLKYLNDCLDELPYEDKKNLYDLPEEVTLIELQK